MIDLDDALEKEEQDAQNELLVCNTCPFCDVSYCFMSGKSNIECRIRLRNTDNSDWYYSCGYTLAELNKLGGYDYNSWDYVEIKQQLYDIEKEL